MNLSNIIENIKQELINIHGPICIYISVGAAAHRVEMKDNAPFLDDLYYHQYPKFLEEMQIIDNLTTIHILIDTSMELPPFMTIDKRKGLDFISSGNNKYKSTNNRHIVYSLKQTITMCAYNLHNNYIDITSELHELNNIAIEENILLVYNDFTGKSNKPIAEYFDNMISPHLDHIIYGLGSRCDFGCYIDILKPICKFAYILDKNEKRNIIKVFNIFDLIYKNKNINEEIEKYPLDTIDVISTTIVCIIDDTYKYFIDTIFPVLRTVYQLLTEKLSIDDLGYFLNTLFEKNIFTPYINSTDINYKLLIDNLYQNIELKEYKECFDQLIEAFSYHLDKLIYVKQLDANRLELMKQITSDINEYTWITHLKNI